MTGAGGGGPHRSPHRVALALYRTALRAFPSHHRKRYALEMLDAFERELVRRRGWAGRLGAFAFTSRACLDALVAGVGERRRARRSDHPGRLFVGLRHDFTHALRGLAKSWMYTGVSVLSLACGLGVTMAIFLLLRQTLEPPFPVDERGLAEVFVRDEGRIREVWSYPDYADVASAAGSIQSAGWAIAEGMLRLGSDDPGRQVRTAYVGPRYFDIFDIVPPLGRGISDMDGTEAGPVPVVLTDAAWRSWLASDPEVIGRTVTIDRVTHVVVGVAPRYFRGHRAGQLAQLFVPLARHPSLTPDATERFDRDAFWLRVVARAPAGSSVEEVDAAFASTMERLASEHPETNVDRGSIALPYAWQGAEVSDVEGLVFRAVFGGIQGLVLLIVCLNLAGMVLVRSATRERELALRLAIGSSRGRLIQYLMAESVTIGVAGGVLVIGVLQGGLWFLSRNVGPLPVNVAIDATVVGVCMALSLAAALLFGLLPALRFSRMSLVSRMRNDGGGGGGRPGRLHRFAVAMQVALAVPVLIVAGSVTQGVRSMTEAEYGVTTEGLLVTDRLDLTTQAYDPTAVHGLARAIRDDVARLPGVRAVTVSDRTPLDGTRAGVAAASLETGSTLGARLSRVDEHFFETMEIPVVRGRAFSADDVAGADPVAMLTASLAERLFGGEPVLGRRLTLTLGEGDDATRDYTVVGITDEVAGPFLESDTDNVFLAYWQEPTPALTVAVRATTEDEALTTAIGDAFVTLDPTLAAPTVRPFSTVIENRGRDMPLWSVFFSVVSGLLLALSALGIYGIVAFTVANRTREIGIRMSLGSSRRGVLTDVVRDAVKFAAPGLVIGSALGVLVGQAILNRMYAQIGLPMADARIMVVAAVATLVVVVVASVSPARGAASVDPMEALRAE